MKLTITARKPRNPFVAASLRRQAGSHGRRNVRQQAQRELRLEMSRLRNTPT